MRIAIGCDHGGFHLKEEILPFLKARNIEFHDFGCFGAESVDYPDVAIPLAKAVASGEFERGILLCGTGIGVSLAANKVRGIRAAVIHDTYSARMAREHNDLNVLTLGGRVIGPDLACEVVRVFLTTEFSGDPRHIRRVAKIMVQEKAAD